MSDNNQLRDDLEDVGREVRKALDEAAEEVRGAAEYAEDVIDSIDEDLEDGVFGYRGGRTISFNLEGGLWPLAVLAFLVLGFVWDAWHPGWLVFPAAWVLGEVIRYIRHGKFYISLYGIATVVYLFIGFMWHLWHPGWLIFVAAWAITAMFPYKKNKKKKSDRDD